MNRRSFSTLAGLLILLAALAWPGLLEARTFASDGPNKPVGGITACPSQTNVLMDQFLLRQNSGTATVTNIQITGANTANIASVRIYRDTGSTPGQLDGTDVFLNSATFAGAIANVAVNENVTITAVNYLVLYNIVAAPANGAALTSQVTDITTNDTKNVNATISRTATVDAAAPTIISNLVATPGNNQVSLAWTNIADYAEVLIKRKTGGYPASHTDATATTVYDSTTPASPFVDNTAINGTTYYYAVFVKDACGNWNDTVDSTLPNVNAVTATPTAPVCDLTSLDIIPVVSLPGGTIVLAEGANQNFTAGCTYVGVGCGVLSDNCAQAGGVNWSKIGSCSISTPGPSVSTLATANQIPGPNGGSCQVSGQAAYGAGNYSDSTNITITNNDTLSTVDVTPNNPSVAEGGVVGFSALATWSDGFTEQVACGGAAGVTTWNLTGNLTLGACAANTQNVSGNQVPCGAGGSGTVNATYQAVSDASASTVTVTNNDVVSTVDVTPNSPVTLAEGASQGFQALATWNDGCTEPVACNAGTTWNLTGNLTAGTCAANVKTITANQVPCGAGGSGTVNATYQAVSDASATAVTVTNNDSLSTVNVTPNSPVNLAEGASQGFQALAAFSDGCTQPVACDAGTTWTLTGDLTAGGCAANVKTVTANQVPCGPGGSGTVNATYQAVSDLSASAVTVTNNDSLSSVDATPNGPSNVQPGNTVDFSCVGAWSDGCTNSESLPKGAAPAYSLPVNGSGGNVNPSSGLYTAGATDPSSDTLRCTISGLFDETAINVQTAAGGTCEILEPGIPVPGNTLEPPTAAMATHTAEAVSEVNSWSDAPVALLNGNPVGADGQNTVLGNGGSSGNANALNPGSKGGGDNCTDVTNGIPGDLSAAEGTFATDAGKYIVSANFTPRQRMEVTNFNVASIPVGATITSVTLRVVCGRAGAVTPTNPLVQYKDGANPWSNTTMNCTDGVNNAYKTEMTQAIPGITTRAQVQNLLVAFDLAGTALQARTIGFDYVWLNVAYTTSAPSQTLALGGWDTAKIPGGATITGVTLQVRYATGSAYSAGDQILWDLDAGPGQGTGIILNSNQAAWLEAGASLGALTVAEIATLDIWVPNSSGTRTNTNITFDYWRLLVNYTTTGAPVPMTAILEGQNKNYTATLIWGSTSEPANTAVTGSCSGSGAAGSGSLTGNQVPCGADPAGSCRLTCSSGSPGSPTPHRDVVLNNNDTISLVDLLPNGPSNVDEGSAVNFSCVGTWSDGCTSSEAVPKGTPPIYSLLSSTCAGSGIGGANGLYSAGSGAPCADAPQCDISGLTDSETVNVQPAAVCTHAAPTVAIVGASGQSVCRSNCTANYTFTVKNNDVGAACPAGETYNLGYGTPPAGFSASGGPASVLVAKGATSGNLTFQVCANGSASGSWANEVISATAQSGNDPVGSNNSISTSVDLAVPLIIADLVGAPGSGQATLIWTNLGDYSRVLIKRKTGGYPASHTDASAVTVLDDLAPLAGPDSFLNSPLSNGTTYFYAIYVADACGNWNDTTTAGQNAATVTPAAGCTHAAPTVAVIGTANKSVCRSACTTNYTFTVTNHDSPSCAAENYNLAYGAPPAGFSASGGPAATGPLNPGQTSGNLTFSVCANGSASGSWANQVLSATAQSGNDPAGSDNSITTTVDLTQPTRVGDLTAVAGNAQVTLDWTNLGDYAEVLIKRKAGSYPAGHTDATAATVLDDLAPAAGPDSFLNSPLVNETTYYYAVYVKDSCGNWNDQTTAGSNARSAKPTAGCTHAAPTVTMVGPTSKNVCRSDCTTSYAFTVKNNDSGGGCAGETYDIGYGTPPAGFNATGADSAGPLNPGQTSGQVSFQVCANATASGSWANEVLTATAQSGNDPAGSNNLTTTTVDLTAPAIITTLTAAPGDTRVTLNWTNLADHARVLIKRKTGGYPAGHADATALTLRDDLNPSAGADSYQDLGLVNGTAYYYAVYVADSCGNWNDTTTVNQNARTATPNPVVDLVNLSNPLGQPAAGNISQGTLNKVVLKIRLAVGSNAARVTQLKVKKAGNAVNATDILRVTLWTDRNADGYLSREDLLAVGTWGAVDSSYTFSGLDLNLAFGASQDFLVAVDLTSAATVGRTLTFSSDNTLAAVLLVASPDQPGALANFTAGTQTIAAAAVVSNAGMLLHRSNTGGNTCGGATNACHNYQVHSAANLGSAKWGGTWGSNFTCQTCHDPHATTNIGLIKAQVTTNGAPWGGPSLTNQPAVFRSRGTGDPLNPDTINTMSDEGDGVSTQICMVCHTITAHHRNNDAVTDSHHDDEICTTCHTHESGFGGGGESTGGSACAGCHGGIWARTNGTTTTTFGGANIVSRHTLGNVAGTNDSANQAVPNASWNVASLSTVAAANRSCTNMCHKDHPHDEGGSNHRFNLYEDPSTNLTRGAVNPGHDKDFDNALASKGLCIGCHDVPVDANHPAIDGAAYNSSSHNFVSVGATNYQYLQHDSAVNPRNCTKCHHSPDDLNPSDAGTPFGAAHFSSYNALLFKNVRGNNDTPNFLCYDCHDTDGPAANNLLAVLGSSAGTGKAFKHPIYADTVHDDGAEAAAADFRAITRHSNCDDCHDPHQARAGTHTLGSDASGPPLTGAWGVTPTVINAYTTGQVNFVNGSTVVTCTTTCNFTTSGIAAGWRFRNEREITGTWYYVKRVIGNTSIALTTAYARVPVGEGQAAYWPYNSGVSPLPTNGVKYTAQGIGGWTKVNPATKEYQVCFKCHSDYAWNIPTSQNSPPASQGGWWSTSGASPWRTQSYPPQTDVAMDFSTGLLSFHPVMGQGRNQPATNANAVWTSSTARRANPSPRGVNLWGLGNNFVNGWDYVSLVTCSDCHGSDSASDPVGPHGSANRWLLKSIALGVQVTTVGGAITPNATAQTTAGSVNCGGTFNHNHDLHNFCVNCHRGDIYGLLDQCSDKGCASWTNGNFARVTHPVDARTHSNDSGACASTAYEIFCMQCHGGDSLGGIHGSNAKFGTTASGGKSAAVDASSYRGIRMLNGATWTGHTRPTTGAVTCWTKNYIDAVNLCGQGHDGSGGNSSNYDYQSPGNATGAP